MKALIRNGGGLILGGLGGYLYYVFIGCRTGGCVLQSSPVFSTLFGALLGYIIFDELGRYRERRLDKKQED